jgi:hypothetical protein
MRRFAVDVRCDERSSDKEEALMTIEATRREATTSTTTIRSVGIVTFLLAVGMPIVGILTAGIRGSDVEPGVVDWVFVGVVALIAIATFSLLVPRLVRRSGPTAGLILSLVAFVTSFVAFWTMVPLILGAAGAVVGYEATRGDAGTPARIGAAAAVILGAIAVIGSVVATLATS